MSQFFNNYIFPMAGDDRPFSHQLKTVKFALANRRAFILNDMGTGKTLSVLWASDILICHDKIKNGVLIVAPLSTLIDVWATEIKTHFPHRSYTILHGTKAQRLSNLSTKRHFYIINHDGIKTIEKQLIQKGFELVIVDELTAYKNWSAARTQSMARIVKHIGGAWGMTGEPTPNSPFEAYGQARVIRPENVPQEQTTFYDRVIDEISAYDWLPRRGWELHVKKALSPAVRYKLRDCVDLPPTVIEKRKFEMSKEQKRMYDEMYEHFVTQFKEGRITAANAGVKALKLLQIASGCVYDEDKFLHSIDNKPKLKGLMEVYEESGYDKIVIFAPFRGALYEIQKYAQHNNIKHGLIHGDVKLNERQKILNEFKKGASKWLIMQPATSRYGLNLTVSRTIVWFTPAPSNETFNQSNARIVRPGQERTQRLIFFRNSTAEQRIYRALQNRGNMSKSLLDLFRNPA